MARSAARPEELTDTMMRVAAVLRDAEVPYLLAGSFAAWARGAPPRQHDLDFAVRREDIDRAVEVLERAGFEEHPTPEEWLRKVRDGDVVVDLIFDPAGLSITDEVIERGADIEVGGMTFCVMAIEDVLTTKLYALKEHNLDYEPVLEMARTLREQIDWDELRRRCEPYPYAKPFFTLVEELGVIEREDGELVSGAEIREAQRTHHG